MDWYRLSRVNNPYQDTDWHHQGCHGIPDAAVLPQVQSFQYRIIFRAGGICAMYQK